MPRPAPGIQLGRPRRPALVRALGFLVVALAVTAAWGAVALYRTSAELRTAGTPTPVTRRPAEIGPVPAPRLAQEAAVLLASGAPGTPSLSRALETLAEAAPDGVRIVGIEVRPDGDRERIEASITAEAASAAATARFLSALDETESVLAAEVISETRQTDGTATIRITTRLGTGSGGGS